MTKDEAQKLWDLIKPLRTGMLVTQQNHALHARPMHLVQSAFEGMLYFFTNGEGLKTAEIEQHPSTEASVLKNSNFRR